MEVHELPAFRPLPVEPRLGESLAQVFDPTPFGWLLAVALVLAGVANVLVGVNRV